MNDFYLCILIMLLPVLIIELCLNIVLFVMSIKSILGSDKE